MDLSHSKDPDLYSSILTENPNGLFENSASYPEAVVAPFWGDHFLRLPNEQAVPSSNGRDVLISISTLSLAHIRQEG